MRIDQLHASTIEASLNYAGSRVRAPDLLQNSSDSQQHLCREFLFRGSEFLLAHVQVARFLSIALIRFPASTPLCRVLP